MRRKWLAVGIILLFVATAFSPTYTAKVSTPSINDNTSPKDSPIKRATHLNNDNESFFDFAIIWGPFEIRDFGAPFLEFRVYNPKPWCNRTIYVIGYWIPEHQWFFKKSYDVEGPYHIGVIGFHRLAIIAYGNVAAF